jgi:hypothetical protein
MVYIHFHLFLIFVAIDHFETHMTSFAQDASVKLVELIDVTTISPTKAGRKKKTTTYEFNKNHQLVQSPMVIIVNKIIITLLDLLDFNKRL